jgi:hypothetical protein
MSIFLDRINAAPLQGEKFSFDFNTWISVLVDTLNEILTQLEGVTLSRENLTDTSVTAQVNSQYIIGNAALSTVTLPDTAAVGDVVEVVGEGAGGWVVQPGSGQTIEVVSSSASVSVASTNRYDCISMVCVVEDTTWVTRNSQTAGFTIT